MGCCPNERDIILRVIDPKWHRTSSKSHCKVDCWSTACSLSKNFKGSDNNGTVVSRGSQTDC